MLDLVEYLNKYFRGTTDRLAEVFASEFGVDVKHTPQEPTLWLFKYNMLTVKWSRPLSLMCRGVILQFTDEGTWSIVSYPFDKFFNLTEPNCILEADDYEAAPNNYQLLEKADGTCIQMYKYNGTWRVSTLGTIVTMDTHTGDIRFEDLFYQTMERCYNLTRQDLWERLDRLGEYTYIFELCTTRNRIVTRYPEDRIYLLGVRELKDSYRLHTPGELLEFATQIGVRVPRWISCAHFPTLNELQQFVEEEGCTEAPTEDPEVEFPEGYVVLQSARPIAKLKNHRYLTLHKVIGGESDRCVARQLAEGLFLETLDDLMPALSEHHKLGIEAMKEQLREVNERAIHIANELSEFCEAIEKEDEVQEQTSEERTKAIRKAYAQKVIKLIGSSDKKIAGWFRGYFFGNFDKIREGFAGVFTEHLKHEALRTKDNLDYWKEVILQEMKRYYEQQEKQEG